MTDTKAERVLAAAREVFMRYGFKRTTMGDLADAAGMSRPALYLVFSSKEEVFSALLTRLFDDMLGEIRAGLDARDDVTAKLIFAFEVWCVQTFAIVTATPDAKDLLESSYAFATAITAQVYADFERILVDLLQPLQSAQTARQLSTEQLAHILVNATQGLKEAAADVAQLRQMIAGLITIVVAGLQQQSRNDVRPTF